MTQRNRIVLAFDEHYMRNGQTVFAAARHLMRQMGGTAEYWVYGRGRYRGPRFPREFGPVRVVARRQEPYRHEPRLTERLRRWLAHFRLAESRATWISNIEPSDEILARWLFHADTIRAVVVFTLDPEFALQVARLSHVFSTAAPPHVVVVTPQEKAESATVRDLRWLQVKVVWDGNAVAGSTIVGGERANNSRRMWLPTPDEQADGTAGILVPVPFDTPGPVSVLDPVTYPYQFNVDGPEISWRDWIGADCPVPRRVRDIVLWIRPDWMSCGSATLFASLAAHFRSQDALLIDIAIWPYRGDFYHDERSTKVNEQQRHIRSGLYFSLRRTGSIPHTLRQALYALFFPPLTVANQVLLLWNTLSAKPSFMVEAVKHAKVNLIYVNHYFTYLFARNLIAGRPFFLDTHDIQSINFVHNGTTNVLTRRADQYHRLVAQEMRILRRADRLCFVSGDERDIAARYVPSTKLDIIIPLPSIRSCSTRALGKPPRLLTIASSNAANERNLLWFLNQVWPRVLDWKQGSEGDGATPTIQLDVCGSIKKAIRNPTWRWVNFYGQVDHLRGFYEQADVVLLPVVTGGGVAIKTVEALLYGRPVVATRHALRGLPAGVAETVGYSNDPEEFAQTILALLDSAALRLEFAKRSREGANILREERFYDRLVKAMDAVRFGEAPRGVESGVVLRRSTDAPIMVDAAMVRREQPHPRPVAE